LGRWGFGEGAAKFLWRFSNARDVVDSSKHNYIIG
jgi:hypothetical protein